LDVIHDANDDRSYRGGIQLDYLTGAVTLVDNHDQITWASLNHINGYIIMPIRFSVQIETINQQQLPAVKSLMLDGRNDISDYPADIHLVFLTLALATLFASNRFL
jgi:hypothetical protein